MVRLFCSRTWRLGADLFKAVGLPAGTRQHGFRKAFYQLWWNGAESHQKVKAHNLTCFQQLIWVGLDLQRLQGRQCSVSARWHQDIIPLGAAQASCKHKPSWASIQLPPPPDWSLNSAQAPCAKFQIRHQKYTAWFDTYTILLSASQMGQATPSFSGRLSTELHHTFSG